MYDRSRSNGKALSLVIVWLIAASGAFAILGMLSSPARGAVCDQGGGLITANWTVTTAQVCSGILYTVDGSITVASGGSLTLVDGGLSFAKDSMHRWPSLTVQAGGSLILDHSILTVQTVAIDPYLKLALTVSGGSLTMTDGSMIQFPGWFNATGATISLTNSAITGFPTSVLYGTGVYPDDNDDSPLISWASTTASLYGSQIARIYENTTASTNASAKGTIEGNISLTSNSALYAYDSYLAVDYSNVVGLHNELQVDGNSNAYLYNVTIDRTQDPFLESDWLPAFRPVAAGGTIYLHRWLHATVLDSTGFPVSGAHIWSSLSPAATTAQYPDNGSSTTPSSRTLTYLGKSASGSNAWNTTDPNGVAVIPLYTDRITTASLPNAYSFGNYQLTVLFGSSSASGGVGFAPYPAVNARDNNAWVTIPMSGVQVRTGADVALHASDYANPISVITGQPFSVPAVIYNQGQTSATGVSIAAFLDGNRSDQLARVDGLAVSANSFTDVNLSVPAAPAAGTHVVELIVDPDNTINEGGTLQESNNFANVTLNVMPPPAGFIAIGVPAVDASVSPGASLTVSGYVRDSTVNVNPISGLSVTVQLMSGTTSLASATTTTDASGFFLVTLTVPPGTADGTYRISVTSSATTIQADSRDISVHAPASFLNTTVPLLGLPWWLFLIILAAVAAIVIGVTLYFKVYGIGKMVECGECGSFIPEDATRCPRCGVEFEKDMAKCSNCGTWIPVDVKECPECGVQFATGELDMADYQERMHLQFDDVVRKLKEDASRQLSRSLSDQEFQEWWRKQPTFLTFEDWLREEEEMRKQGSKPCPVCGTLNSVTAKVCHKCGSLMRAAGSTIPAGTVRAGAPRRAAPAGPPSEPSEGGTAPPPDARGPLVQKRVIKRGPTEGETPENQPQDDQDL